MANCVLTEGIPLACLDSTGGVKNVYIGAFCIIGVPPLHKVDGELETIIGDNATIRSHSVIYAGNKIGDNFSTGHHVAIREMNTIGNNVSIGSLSCIEHHIKIEDGVRIHSQVFVPEYSVLKMNCWLGPNVVLTNAKYPADTMHIYNINNNSNLLK